MRKTSQNVIPCERSTFMPVAPSVFTGVLDELILGITTYNLPAGLTRQTEHR